MVLNSTFVIVFLACLLLFLVFGGFSFKSFLYSCFILLFFVFFLSKGWFMLLCSFSSFLFTLSNANIAFLVTSSLKFS